MSRIVFPPNALPQTTRLAPSLTGFADAQRALRQTLGVDAVFTIPAGEPVWPPGTPIDPETGRPYDPFLEPVSQDAESQVIVRCSFASRPVAGTDPQATPLGGIDPGTSWLILDEADYPTVASARRVSVGPETYDIRQFRYDEIAGVGRYIAVLEHA